MRQTALRPAPSSTFPAAGAGLLIAALFGLANPAGGQELPRDFGGGEAFRLETRAWYAPIRLAETGFPALPALTDLAPPPPSPPTLGAAAPPRKRFWLAAAELAGLELLPWVYDRYIEDESYARISWHTVSENFKAGFGFDSDHFTVNQTEHPYQGALFFQAGRSNGYTYWESGLFALAGSFLWECCMENTRPSINDLVNTTLGGMTRGEVQHRLSVVILDNTATGEDRIVREIAAAIVNPVGALTRLLDGDTLRIAPNPDERFPDAFAASGDAGYRHVEGRFVEHPDQAIVSLAARYGDVFAAEVRSPFDAFSAALDLSFPGGATLTRLEERGILRSWDLTDRGTAARHVFAFSQEYEYINNQTEVVGAQMFSAGWLSRYTLFGGAFLATDLDVLAVPLAGIKTTNFTNPQTGRSYDYGPGGGALASVRLISGGRDLFSAGYGVVWVHTVDGSSDENTLQFFRAAVTVPVAGALGVGGGYRWYSRQTSYLGGFVEPRRTQSEWRVFLTVAFGADGLRAGRN